MFTHHQLGAWGDIVITVVVIFLGYILCIYIFGESIKILRIKCDTLFAFVPPFSDYITNGALV